MMMIISRFSSFILSPIINLCTRILVYACQGILITSLIFAVTFYFGWIHRWLWHVIEYELSKAAFNSACRLTVGSFEYDLIRGRLWASNLIIHSPNRQAWKWTSPVIARVGKVYVETNLVWVLFSMWFLWEEPPLEVYTLHVSDIQCFVERKHNVFNVHLLDPRNAIPDPSTLLDEESTTTTRDSMVSVDTTTSTAAVDRVAMDESMEQTLQDSSSAAAVEAAAVAISDHDSAAAAGNNLDAMLMDNDHYHHHHQESNNNTTEQDDDDKEGEQTAQRLVNDILSAVESLGQAVQNHGSLPRALNEQRQQIAQRLKRVVMGNHQDDNNNINSNVENNNDKTNNTNMNASKAMKQGVKIVQHVSKAVVEKTQSVQKVVLPPRRAPRKNQKIVYARFGRVVMDDVRVFTRNYKNKNKQSSKLLLISQQQQQRVQLQQQQQQAAITSNGDGSSTHRSSNNDLIQGPSTATASAAAPSSPGVSTGTTANTTTNDAHISPATPPIPSQEAQSVSSSSAPTTAAASQMQYSSLTSAWNKPIVVKRCAVRASEFCPPLHAKEGDDVTSPYLNNTNFAGFPVLYQTMDKCMDVILKRFVADMAKANNGRIFQTALGEVLDYWSTLENKDNNGNDVAE